MHSLSHLRHLWLLVILMLQDMSGGICSSLAVNTVCKNQHSHTVPSIKLYFSASLESSILCNPLIHLIDRDGRVYIKGISFSSRWRTRGRFVCGAVEREGRSRWCQRSDPGERKDMHTDCHLALLSVLLVDAVWLCACVYFWLLGRWSQAFNMIHQDIVTHTQIIFEHYYTVLQHRTEFAQIIMKY